MIASIYFNPEETGKEDFLKIRNKSGCFTLKAGDTVRKLIEQLERTPRWVTLSIKSQE